MALIFARGFNLLTGGALECRPQVRRRSYLGADRLNYYQGIDKSMKLLVTLERDETEMIVAECPAIPGCISQGRTEEEALDNIREAIAGSLEARAANGLPLAISVREVEVPV
jgi:predicted RNase H-like HicB family nuclease